MGKKYLDTKKGTLESSILGVWKTAAEENAVRMDGRTKGYKTHREKLESGRLRREKKNLNKEEVQLDEATGKEIAAKMMKDRSMKAFASKVAKMKTVSRDDLEKMLPDYVAGAAITKLFEEVQLDEKKETAQYTDGGSEKITVTVDNMRKVNIDTVITKNLRPGWKKIEKKSGGVGRSIYDEVDLDEGPMDGFLRLTFKSPADVKKAMKVSDTEFGYRHFSMDKARTRPELDIEGDRDDLQRLKGALKSAGIKFKIDLEEEVKLEEGSKEEYQKFFNAAMKKFKIDSPADLKSDEEKKKFFDYVDKNYKGEKEEELRALKSELKLHEGTWHIPDSSKEKAGLKKLMKKPVIFGKDGDNATDAIAPYIGDDELYNDLYADGKADPKGDARFLIKKAMKRLGIKEEVELDENFGVHKDIPAMEVGTDRYRDYVVGLTPGEGNPEWAKARDFKVQSMRESLIKIWEKAEKQDEDEDEKIAPVKGKKTMTGGAVAKVETKLKIDG